MTSDVVDSNRAGWIALGLLMAAFSALFLATYPPLAAIEDEVGFINQALVWSRGAISAEGAGYGRVADFQEVAGRQVATRNPGRSLLALPFLMVGGLRAVFLSGLLIHLGTTAVAALLLRRLGASPLWAALVLLHPTLALYSRTMLGDAAAGGALLLAALAATATRQPGVKAGLAVGLAALMRYHAALALPFVALGLRFPPRGQRPWREPWLCLAAGVGAGVLIVGYNLVVYQAFMEPFGGQRGAFGPRYLVSNGGFYVVCLFVLWPGMLLAPVLDRSAIGTLARGVCGIFLAFFSLYYFHDRSANPLETLVIGQRLIEVALPVWIVSYAVVLSRGLARLPLDRFGRALPVVAGTILVGLFCGDAAIFVRHQGYLNGLAEARAAVIEQVPAGSLVLDYATAKLFGVAEGSPAYRWRDVDYQGTPLDHSAEIAAERRPWFLAVLSKIPGAPLPPLCEQLVNTHRLRVVETGSPRLRLFRSESPL